LTWQRYSRTSTGHGTLAAASVLYNEEKIDAPELIFHTLSGDLIVKRSESGMLSMDFPKGAPKKIELAEDVQREVAEAVGLDPSRIVDVQFCAYVIGFFVSFGLALSN
jgi:predicted PhzF superfamily epimerase YddE/YHI9